MSKKYKGKTCVYCAERESTCSDHVIAKEFFPEDKRANLPKVPSCAICNNTKSKLEHYATTVLLFGSRHVDAIDMLKKVAPKRLNKNLKLKREIQNKMERTWIKSKENLILPTRMVPISRNELIQLFSMIVRGLYWHNWKLILPADYLVEILTINLQGLIEFRDGLPLNNSSNSVQDNFGNGVFYYRGIKADDDPFISAWELFFYNGMMIAGQGNQLVFFCGLTGPKEMLDRDVPCNNRLRED